MGLTGTAVRTAKVQAMPYKLYNEKGLFLLVKRRSVVALQVQVFGHPEALLSLGMYPVVRRKGARIRAMKRGDSWPQELTRA